MSLQPMREVEFHIGHGTPVSNFHTTAYVSSLNNSVFDDNKKIIVVGDITSCGDPAVIGSPSVFINNRAIHRTTDATGGHGPWIPNQAALSNSK